MSPPTSLHLQSRWDETSYGRMHARTGGDASRAAARAAWLEAPTVVLVHGLVISSRYMVPTAEQLLPHHSVLMPDLPGFGGSGDPRAVLDVPALADALAEWMDVLAIAPALLVGNSLGCQVIVDLLLRYPGRAVGAVLAGPTVEPPRRDRLSLMARAAVDVPREKLSLIPHWAGDFLRAGVRRSWVTFGHAIRDRLEDKLPQVGVPTLVVRGSRDPIVSREWAERVTTLLPDGRLRAIAGGAHAVNYSSAEAFASLVHEFACTIASKPAGRAIGSGAR